MSEFIEECRREWRRLRVPDPVANEMAADLAADLREAEAEGASAEVVLGSGAFDPRAFAASWATERGVMRPRWRDRLRRRPVLLAVMAVLVVLLAASAVGVVLLTATSVSSPRIVTAKAAPVPAVAASVDVPDVLGLQQEEALRVAQASGFVVKVSYRTAASARGGIVLRQSPAAGDVVARGSTLSLVVTR
ncbi:MAG: PASTA domain-containing protein [Gaiellaceae bacterium]|jgi:hypothetical protein